MQHPTAFTRRPPERRVPPKVFPTAPRQRASWPKILLLGGAMGIVAGEAYTALTQPTFTTSIEKVKLDTDLFGTKAVEERDAKAKNVLRQSAIVFKGATSARSLRGRFAEVVRLAEGEITKAEQKSNTWYERNSAMLDLLEDVVKTFEYSPNPQATLTQESIDQAVNDSLDNTTLFSSQIEALLDETSEKSGRPGHNAQLNLFTRQMFESMVYRLVLKYLPRPYPEQGVMLQEASR